MAEHSFSPRLDDTMALLGRLGRLAAKPERPRPWHRELPDIQFDIADFMPAPTEVDGVRFVFPPVYTIFLTARLARLPSRADQQTMEAALRAIEASYPYAPDGVFTHVAYSDHYFFFLGLPADVVNASMPRTVPGDQPVLKRAVPGPSDVAPGSRVFELRRKTFNVPVRLEDNDLLFTIRGDDPATVADVARWLAGSDSLNGEYVGSPRFDAGMTITSSRVMFDQMGLPRKVADEHHLPFAPFINPHSPMWMGFADTQTDSSAPARDVTFAGGDGIKLTTAERGDYFDDGAIQHLSHVLLDLQQFYLDGEGPVAPADPAARNAGTVGVAGTIPIPNEHMGDARVPFQERVQYLFSSPEPVKQNDEPVGMGEDAFLDGGGPKDLSTRGAFVPNVFKGADHARHSAEMRGRMGHVDGLHRSGRTVDGRPLHLRIDGPGFDAMDTTTGRNTPKLQFSGFFPSADFFADLRRNQASADLLEELDLDEDDHGIERFITATRRQNYLVPPRRHRAFPLIEFT
jgi:hypothetical protein